MKDLLFKLITFFTLFVLIASTQVPVQHFFLENEFVLDPASGSSDEWIIQTEPNHIFYFSFLTNEGVDAQQISSFLTILDVNNPDSLLFPSDIDQLAPFYSTSNTVSIKFKRQPNLNLFRLKVAKAVACPFNIGGSTSCGRVVDELSCYCALFTPRTWANTKSYCQSYNMSFLSVESYEEDFGVFSSFAGLEILWIGLSDSSSEGHFRWDSTGKPMAPGYMGWASGRPYSSCGEATADCTAYNVSSALPAWFDLDCTLSYGGICELQPTNSSSFYKGGIIGVKFPLVDDFHARRDEVEHLFVEKEVILDLSALSANEWIINTDENHIFFFTFLNINGADIDELQIEEIQSSLTIADLSQPDSLFSSINQLSPFYSTSNAVSITFSKPSSYIHGFQLKAQKAVPCPFNLGGSSSCGRVVDELSCYCGLFATRTWTDTKDFCKANNMSFVSIESYEEDLAIYTAFGGNEHLWIGASDIVSEGNFVWDSTGKRMSPGYQGWYPGRPYSSCGGSTYDCAVYHPFATIPAWEDRDCNNNLFGGICELQP